MRWYKIVVDGGPTYDSTNDPNALNIELDIPVSAEALPKSGAFVRVWGIALPDLLNAKSLNKKNISVYAGMNTGLPLANPAQQGLIVKGSIFPAFGNWVMTDMTLDMILQGPFGESNPSKPANVIHNWPKGQQLSQAIEQTLKTAFPKFTPKININPNLVLAYTDTGFYQTIGQYATYIQQISRSIINSPDYHGVHIMAQGNNLIVADGTNPPQPKQVNFQDLIGQPIWIGPNEVQFKCVMRGDFNLGDVVTLPKTLASLNGNSGSQFSGSAASNLIQGKFLINQIRHTGNFRQPDWASWCSTFNGIPQKS